jgi:hypothetical protein
MQDEAGCANGALEVEAVVLGPADTAETLEPWRRLTEMAARVVWRTQTDMGGKLSVALLPGPSPTHHEAHRIVVGAYSPDTHTVIIFVEGLDRVRRSRTYLQQMMRTLAHETTHAVQHCRNPASRPGRGSVMLDPESYKLDANEQEAMREESAFDHALFTHQPPPELAARAEAYRHNLTAEFVEQIHELEE